MLSQLYQANRLSYEGANDGTLLFDPDFLLRRLSWLIAVILSKPFLLVWLLTVAVAVNYGVENFDALKDQTHGFLSPSNIGWVYVCTVLVKLIHEFGHASVVKKYGGEVHTVGVMFMLLAPLPYVMCRNYTRP